MRHQYMKSGLLPLRCYEGMETKEDYIEVSKQITCDCGTQLMDMSKVMPPLSPHLIDQNLQILYEMYCDGKIGSENLIMIHIVLQQTPSRVRPGSYIFN